MWWYPRFVYGFDHFGRDRFQGMGKITWRALRCFRRFFSQKNRQEIYGHFDDISDHILVGFLYCLRCWVGFLTMIRKLFQFLAFQQFLHLDPRVHHFPVVPIVIDLSWWILQMNMINTGNRSEALIMAVRTFSVKVSDGLGGMIGFGLPL